jgi:nitrogen fixation protein FixH
MKPNHLIVLAFVLFIGFILTLVYKTFGVKDDLVAEDYYNQEIAYQTTIDQKSNVTQDSSNVTYKINDTGITLDFFSKDNKSTQVKGTALFLRPSDAAMDIKLPFESSNGSTELSKEKLSAGLYIMKVQWNQNGTEYFKEEQIYIQ